MAKEGLIVFFPFFFLAILLFYLFSRSFNINFVYLSVISFAIGCILMLFFRDPERKIPDGDNLIVSPADGKIVNIEKNNSRVVVSIFLSIFNVHINRIPVTGRVTRLAYKPGKFFAAFKKSASELNERFEIEIETDRGPVVVHQIAGVLARRVVCRLKKEQSVKIGDRFGLIRFGSRVDLFLPVSSQLQVKKGQKVKGGETIIGRLT